MAIGISRLERIAAGAQHLRFRKAVLTLAVMPFYSLGWATGKLWLAIAWVVVALSIGWQEAMGQDRVSGRDSN